MGRNGLREGKLKKESEGLYFSSGRTRPGFANKQCKEANWKSIQNWFPGMQNVWRKSRDSEPSSTRMHCTCTETQYKLMETGTIRSPRLSVGISTENVALKGQKTGFTTNLIQAVILRSTNCYWIMILRSKQTITLNTNKPDINKEHTNPVNYNWCCRPIRNHHSR